MDWLFYLGLTAGTLTTISLLPQVSQAYKTRHTKDISLTMFILFSGGLVLWIIYGLYLGSFPVILANLVTLALSLYLISLKIKYG